MIIDMTGEEPTQDAVDEFLAHYGVKGMRWGHRGAAAKDDNPTPKTVKRRKGRKAERPDPKHMTDKELAAALKRLNMERQYASLNKTPNKAAKDFTKEIGKNAAKTVLTGIAVKQLSKLANPDTLGKLLVKTS